MKTFLQKLSLEWIPLARISFGLLLLINSISNMKQIPQHFFKDLNFSIKLSGVRANCSTLECQGQKKNNNNKNNQTNIKKKMIFFLLQKYTTLIFSITTPAIA